MTLKDFDLHLRELLSIDLYAKNDSSWNGIQIECDREIRKVAVAVDAALETAERAAEWGADLLLVHHGLFWGSSERLTGVHFRRLRSFFAHNLGLYGIHLPLDAHERYGNNAVMAARLGLTGVSPFGEYKGVTIGWAGELPRELSTEEVARTLFGTTEDLLGILPFGPERNRTVGIISGGAPYDVVQAIDRGLDLFITGDASHSVYHVCLEGRINAMFAGHYRTETWGVQALAGYLTENLNLETTFLDVPTGL